MTRHYQTAWAIKVRRSATWLDPEKVYFAGRYQWFEGMSPKIPASAEGCHIALFNTRELARAAAKNCRYRKTDGRWLGNCYATAVKVRLDVIELEGPDE